MMSEPVRRPQPLFCTPATLPLSRHAPPSSASSSCDRRGVAGASQPRLLPATRRAPAPKLSAASPTASVTHAQLDSTSPPSPSETSATAAAAYITDSAPNIPHDDDAAAMQAESLDLLEWPELTRLVLEHATTPLGRVKLVSPTHPQHLYVAPTQPESEHLLAQTREVRYLEHDLATPLVLSGGVDIAPIVAQAVKGRVLSGHDLLAVAKTLSVARTLRRLIDARPRDDLPVLHDLVAALRTYPAAERELLRCIDEYGDVVESADPTLRDTRQQMRTVTADARALLNALMAKHGDAIQDRLITSRYDRLVIPVKSSYKSTFRRGIVHDASATGNTVYIEPVAVKPLNDNLRRLAAKERAAVHAVLQRLSADVVAAIGTGADVLCDVVATLDAAAARMRACHTFRGVDVYFDNKRPLNVLEVRHPLLVWRAIAEQTAQDRAEQLLQQGPAKKKRDDDKRRRGGGGGDDNVGDDAISTAQFAVEEPVWEREVVPSSYILGDSVKVVCVTGPNTGGKTLSLKTLGLISLMAKAGLFIPARIPRAAFDAPVDNSVADTATEPNGVRLPYFDRVLADIGDDQSLVQSLSTFSGHVRRIRRILAAATSQSLALLDEIGSGTDPAEGAALGMSILRHLAERNGARLTFATTHHGELKALKYATDGSGVLFENASVEFDDVKMRPTFRLLWGIPGRSNALAIAERLGMDGEIVRRAREALRGSRDSGGAAGGVGAGVDVGGMITSLERERRGAEDARVRGERALAEAEAARAEVAARLARLRSEEDALRRQVRATVDDEVRAARGEIARVIRDMQRGGGSAQAAARAGEQLERMHGTAAENANATGTVGADEVEVGDWVSVTGFSDGEAEVVGKPSAKEVLVGMGGMRLKVKLRDIASVRKQPRRAGGDDVAGDGLASGGGGGSEKQNSLAAEKGGGLTVRTSANTVDVRGERADAAVASVDKAIGKGVALGTLYIVHGHGTGRLRTVVREFLDGCGIVTHIRDAEQADGGKGVTIAYF